jgi:hypothetical protein
MVEENSIPPEELERWYEAPEIEPGIRSVKIQLLYTLEVTMNFNDFMDEVQERLGRWRQGQYTLKEAAKVLAKGNPGQINADSFCQQLEKAIQRGRLFIRKHGVRIEQEDLPRGRLGREIVEARDLNEWLEKEGSPYRLSYPYDEQEQGDDTKDVRSSVTVHSSGQPAVPEAAILENRIAALASQPRGAKGLILEHWDKVEARYGPQANGRQVLRVLSQFLDGADRIPELKTIQNHLSALREAKLIP